MIKEEWKVVEGFEDYQVSNLGRVKSLSRSIWNGQNYYISKDRILKQTIDYYGYYVVALRKDLKSKSFKVHKLVAISFLKHIPSGYKEVVDHINNNHLDNRLENLQLISQRENVHKDRGNESSKFIGVSWDKASKKWRSQIYLNGKHIKIGWFNDELEASNAYQNKLKEFNEL